MAKQRGVVVMIDDPAVTAELYDRIEEKLGTGDSLPEGCLVHIDGPGPEGWRIVAVWESHEKAQHYTQNTLNPVLAELGITGPPKLVTWDLYDLRK